MSESVESTMSTESAPNPERRGRGRPPLFDAAALLVIEGIAQRNPTASLEELIDLVEAETGIRAGRSTLGKRLKDLGFTRVVPARRPSATASPPEAATESEPGSPRYGYGAQHREQAPEALYPHCLSDAEWELVRDIFEDPVRGVERRYSRRSMVDAMCYVVRGGVPWRMLPHEFPPWHQVYKTFRRWAAQDRFERMYDRLRRMWREREGRSAEPTAAVIDSQSVKTSAQGGPKGFDGGKKVKGRKRHLMTDVLGLLLVVVVQVASVQDRDGADEVVEAGMAKAPTIEKLYADAGYGGKCRTRLEATHPGLSVEIARHPANRSVGRRLQGQEMLPLPVFAPKTFVPLPKRWVVERTNAWNDRPRRLAKDQDRTLLSSTAWIWFAEGRRLLRRLAVPAGLAMA